MKTKDKKFNSKVIHSGHGADETTGAVMPPIHLSSTFKQNSPGDFTYEYARTGNPTRDILNIASNLNINATLYNAMGQPVLQENNVRQIDMSEFEGGIYNLILSYENIQFTKKIIKQ